MADDSTFFRALGEVLDPLLLASNLLHVVDRVERCGLMSELRDGVDVPAAAASLGLPEESARTLVAALVANGVAEPIGDGFRLTGPWRAITEPGGFLTLRSILERNRLVDRMLRGSDGGYFDLAPAERMEFARGISPNPYSPELVERFRQDLAADPWWADMVDGGRYLELGCGLAGRILTLLQAAPLVCAVGVELDPDLAAEARRRATELGVADRFQVVVADATTYVADEPFDAAFWAQWFFPTDTRAAALASLFANVRSGAVVRAPLFGDHAAMAADPTGVEARSYAVEQVMLDAWGVPERTPEQLRDELTAAGFVGATVVVRDGGLAGVFARKP